MRLPHLQPFAREPLYFLTTCIADRREILANAAAHKILSEIWSNSAKHDGWFVGRYVIMPDHVHLFARAASEAKPRAAWVKTWKSISSRRLAEAFQLTPPIWQADYFDHFIRSADSYGEKWSYVLNNPVRKNLVARPEDWPWQGKIHDLAF